MARPVPLRTGYDAAILRQSAARDASAREQRHAGSAGSGGQWGAVSSTVGVYAHFVEAAVHAATGEIRVWRMLAVCNAGRILNPLTARSQIISAMTMGVGAAIMEELAVDARYGFFVNHDLAGCEVPVHADIHKQEVIFMEGEDAYSTPLKAKGVGELSICSVSAAVANAIYNATGLRVREYPVTLDKLLAKLPAI